MDSLVVVFAREIDLLHLLEIFICNRDFLCLRNVVDKVCSESKDLVLLIIFKFLNTQVGHPFIFLHVIVPSNSEL